MLKSKKTKELETRVKNLEDQIVYLKQLNFYKVKEELAENIHKFSVGDKVKLNPNFFEFYTSTDFEGHFRPCGGHDPDDLHAANIALANMKSYTAEVVGYGAMDDTNNTLYVKIKLDTQMYVTKHIVSVDNLTIIKGVYDERN